MVGLIKYTETKIGGIYEFKIRKEFNDNTTNNLIYSVIIGFGVLMMFSLVSNISEILKGDDRKIGDLVWVMIYVSSFVVIPGFLLRKGIRDELIILDLETLRLLSNKNEVELSAEDRIEVERNVKKSGIYNNMKNGAAAEISVGDIKQIWSLNVYKNNQQITIFSIKTPKGYSLLTLAKSLGKKLNLPVADRTTDHVELILPNEKESSFVQSIKPRTNSKPKTEPKTEVIVQNREAKVVLDTKEDELVLLQTLLAPFFLHLSAFLFLTGSGSVFIVMISSFFVGRLKNGTLILSDLIFILPFAFGVLFAGMGIHILNLFSFKRKYIFQEKGVEMIDKGFLMKRKRFQIPINDLIDVQILNVAPVYLLEFETRTTLYPVEYQFSMSEINKITSAINNFYSHFIQFSAQS